ncbi:MAG: AIPR family protein [Hydrogenophaga sp.]|uniref:AIPR family protein n=1 Tax=Hydrogenophaga sp. TaxID=1904254 RepID=UPI002ABC76ED|nr:AIPR family protein [Hydrogenophaga sp.]MDZ4103073.1 AIPR family protein [Hydrogenophaga sp.]
MVLGQAAAKALAAKKASQKLGQQRLYATLCKVLDSLRMEAPSSQSIYHPAKSNHDGLIQARSRALLHLYLKARFGLSTFAGREKFVTDGPWDGGIDAFYIDEKAKRIHILQSKFRADAQNFSQTAMTAGELLKMDVDRITKGKKEDDLGNKYNDQIIKGLQKAIQGIPDIGRYDYRVVLLGNTKNFSSRDIKKLIDGFEVDQFPHDRIYSDLLFPVVNGTYFSEPDLTIEINLANGGQTDLDYDVKARDQKTNIKLLFVPTREIGRIMHTYKNSVLKYNPRSFLELSSNPVNTEIEASIRSNVNNEFALFNNGVTIISDRTEVNSNTAKADKAQIILSNPQLVNGGQTAFTLGRIYEECEASKDFSVFRGKEVLLRVITFVAKQTVLNSDSRLKLLGEISKASNSQTKVDESDRRSNDPIQIKLQKHFFDDYGLYYERKRGEFSDGLRSGYITLSSLVNRDKLVRVCLAGDYKISQARSSISKFYLPGALESLFKVKDIIRYAYGYEALNEIDSLKSGTPKIAGDRYFTSLYGQGLRYGQYAILAACINYGSPDSKTPKQALAALTAQWKSFEDWVVIQPTNSSYKVGNGFDFANYYKGSTVGNDVKAYPFTI